MKRKRFFDFDDENDDETLADESTLDENGSFEFGEKPGSFGDFTLLAKTKMVPKAPPSDVPTATQAVSSGDVWSEPSSPKPFVRRLPNVLPNAKTAVVSSVPSGDEPTKRVFSPEEISDEILLSTVDGIGPLTTERLVSFFGSATEVLRASRRDLERVEKIGPTLAKKIADARTVCDVDALIRFCRDSKIEILSIRDARFPERLREIANPPRLLYVRGEVLPIDRTALAVVGTRGVSQYGIEQTTRLSRNLVEAGFTVVSGLALGVDGCAHRAALAAGGRTLAVLGCGVAKIYPREHENLARQVAESGAVLSEYHPLTSPLPGNFPARNRIVSGLALGVLVVESPKKSGSLITARLAAEQNRDVFAVPGPIDRATSSGCHQLLREGAALVETVDDILNALAPFDRPNAVDDGERRRQKRDETSAANAPDRSRRLQTSTRPPASTPRGVEKESSALSENSPKTFANLNEEERRIVSVLENAPKSIDLVVRETGFAASKIVGLIAALEFKKVVRRREGNAVSLR